MTFCSCGREREENAAYTERYLVRNAVLAGEADEVGGACHASGCRFNVYNAHDVSEAQYTTTVERVSTRGAGHFKMLQRCRVSAGNGATQEVWPQSVTVANTFMYVLSKQTKD